MELTTASFDYPLEQELIAQQPLERRDASRLMVLHRGRGVEHRQFAELPQLLRAGDLLVVNDTKVVNARFLCRRPSGGKVEGLFLRQIAQGPWEVMLKNAARCRIGECLQFPAADGHLKLIENRGKGCWLAELWPPQDAIEWLTRHGSTPLPPYIHRGGASQAADPASAAGSVQAADIQRYQTVYAQAPGAVAAPTAGLHFTPEMFDRLAAAGIGRATLTLHVGAGTFLPVKTEQLGEHRMHSEWYELAAAQADALNLARKQGRRIVAVGTTSVRVLETLAAALPPGGQFQPTSGWTDIFIYPPRPFRAVDAMITNFHLPRSTLLMLVSAFCEPGGAGGIKMILDAYAQARELKYRFFSYGDAMLID